MDAGMIVYVAEPRSPALAPYAAVRDRDLARRDGLFVVEGQIALEHLVTAGRFPVESVLIGESRQAPLAGLLQGLDPQLPVYVVPQATMDAVTGFHIHRGVLAMARRLPPASVAEVAPAGAATLLGLIGLSNHDNVGGCFRNAAAFGADAVLLDETSCDPLYRKSIRVSSGAALSVPFAHGGRGEAMVDELMQRGFECWSLTPSGGEPLQALQPPQRLALLLGAEGPGLPDALMDRTRRVTIPIAAGFDSLNVATAGAIALAHVFSARRNAGPVHLET